MSNDWETAHLRDLVAETRTENGKLRTAISEAIEHLHEAQGALRHTDNHPTPEAIRAGEEIKKALEVLCEA
jgi:hypothetical protein